VTPAFVEDTVAPLPSASESEMKRDMDLMRQILLEVESWNDLGPRQVSIDGVDDIIKLNREVERLYDTGYLEGITSSPIQSPYKRIAVTDLSPKGQDLLNSIRNPEVWSKTKKGAEAAGGFTVDLLFDLAKGFIKRAMEDLTGFQL
jgi:hypothetical protein